MLLGPASGRGGRGEKLVAEIFFVRMHSWGFYWSFYPPSLGVACMLWLVVKRCLFRLATVEPVEICFMLHTRVCVVDRTVVVGVVMMVSTGYILRFLRFCVVPLLSYSLWVGWLSDMFFLMLPSTKMRSANCEYAPHYIESLYIPACFVQVVA